MASTSEKDIIQPLNDEHAIMKLLHPVELVCLALMSTKLYCVHREVHGVVKLDTEYLVATPENPSNGELSDLLKEWMEDRGFAWVVWARDGGCEHYDPDHFKASKGYKMKHAADFIYAYPCFYVPHAFSKDWPVNKRVPKFKNGNLTHYMWDRYLSVTLKSQIYLHHIGKRRPRYHWNDFREAEDRVSEVVIHHV
ncbi:hypothetical protein HYALB_00011804 [Hymenoscyphus albidus]|uniref:Uncharacterized protein n=1 Tax=Hymenoscyphus albidus TaxID=595503 RepID=A0A9N9PX86_9HELO|nr:hypothetical protein HYALB_00011804 [Hymenoscyphus albidus]